MRKQALKIDMSQIEKLDTSLLIQRILEWPVFEISLFLNGLIAFQTVDWESKMYVYYFHVIGKLNHELSPSWVQHPSQRLAYASVILNPPSTDRNAPIHCFLEFALDLSRSAEVGCQAVI